MYWVFTIKIQLFDKQEHEFNLRNRVKIWLHGLFAICYRGALNPRHFLRLYSFAVAEYLQELLAGFHKIFELFVFGHSSSIDDCYTLHFAGLTQSWFLFF